jgi:hypothetical protein
MAKTTKNQFFLLFFAGMIVALVGIVVGVYAGIGLVLLLGVLFYHARFGISSSVASQKLLSKRLDGSLMPINRNKEYPFGTPYEFIVIICILLLISVGLLAWIGIMLSDFLGYVDWGL